MLAECFLLQFAIYLHVSAFSSKPLLTPNQVGVTVAKIKPDGPRHRKTNSSKANSRLDLHKLDNAIKKYIPSGFSVKDKSTAF